MTKQLGVINSLKHKEWLVHCVLCDVIVSKYLLIKFPYYVLQTCYIKFVKLYYLIYSSDGGSQLFPSRGTCWSAPFYDMTQCASYSVAMETARSSERLELTKNLYDAVTKMTVVSRTALNVHAFLVLQPQHSHAICLDAKYLIYE